MKYNVETLFGRPMPRCDLLKKWAMPQIRCRRDLLGKGREVRAWGRDRHRQVDM